MKSLLFLALAVVPTVALAAPKPTSSPTVLAGNRAKAMTFLDGVAASYRKLNSLSTTWYSIGGYNHVKEEWSIDYKSEGTLAWRTSRPVQVRYEDKTGQILFVTNGQRHLTRVDNSDTVEKTEENPLVELNTMGSDEVSRFFINGLNPLRDPEWGHNWKGKNSGGQARLLGSATVKGVRCRGVEIKRHEVSREHYELSSERETDYVFTLWFDSRNLMRRYQRVTLIPLHSGEDSRKVETIDFEAHPNVKLSPSLFTIPALPK